MQKLDFGEALDYVVAQDTRYGRDAYVFLRDALDFTVKQRKKIKDVSAHVSGQQLLEGLRIYALKQFGPMVTTVFEYWGVRRCEDFGEMVFNLIGIGVFGRTERDTLDDFKGAYTFHEAFVAPYLPLPRVAHQRIPFVHPAEEWN